MKTLLAAALLALLCGMSPAAAPAQEYSIGEGDLLQITVYDNPDLATGTRVSGEGKITFPLIGDVEVSGLTAAEAQQRIAERLKEGYIKTAGGLGVHRGVPVEEGHRARRIQKPGLIELRGNATLMEVISAACGATQRRRKLVIKRRS